MMIKEARNTMKRQLLFIILFLALFKTSRSQDEGVNSQQNVKSEGPSLSITTTIETEKESILSSATNTIQCNQSQQLLIISFDGFRYDYFDAFQMDNLQNISRSGVHAKNGMKGVFTTKTFPSHWSIATGMNQQSHGIVGNRFYDPIKEKIFGKKNDQFNEEWFKGEPIWVTAKKCGKKVGIYFWVGSEIDFGSNLNPDEFKKYNQSVPLEDRINQVIHWLTVSKYDLVMMYWNEPDTMGHAFGTFSTQVHQSLNEIDGQLNRLINALKKHDLLQKTNMIILSDHGMANTTTHLSFSSNVSDNVVYFNEGVVTHFWPKNNESQGFIEETLTNDLANSSRVVNTQDNRPFNFSTIDLSQEDLSEDRLRTARRLDGDNVTSISNEPKLESASSTSRPTQFYTIYRKEQLPEKWKYKNNERVAPIVVVAEEGVYLQQEGSTRHQKAANHGYDNDLMSMRPLFIASGPDFKANYTFEDPIEMINLYSLFCHLLRIKPSSSNEGSIKQVAHILSSHSLSTRNDDTIVSDTLTTLNNHSGESRTENSVTAGNETTGEIPTAA